MLIVADAQGNSSGSTEEFFNPMD